MERTGDLGDAYPDEEGAAIGPHEPGTCQLGEVDRPGQGAMPDRGGGEPEEVGDRSRPQERRPVASDVWIGDRETAASVPYPGVHEGTVVDRPAQTLERLGGAPEGHGSDGRTIIG